MKKIDITRVFVFMAAFVIIIAGMKAAQDLIVPFLLALFIAILCTPILLFLRRIKVPNVLAVIIIVMGIVAAGMLLTTVIVSSVSSFSNNLPHYQASLTEKTTLLFTWLRGHGIDFSFEKIESMFDPGAVMRMIGSTLTSLSSMLSYTFIIFLMVVFILLETAGFSEKMEMAVGSTKKSALHLSRMTKSVNRYMALKTIISASTGLIIALALWIIGVDYPLLWGILAFVLNFIPNIGSIIAAIPAVLLALIQLGLGSALVTTGVYFVVNMIVGSVIEPKCMGKGLGLSTMIVFISLIFWGWVLGPVGMILSVPLTVIMKIALESDQDRRWIAVLMGNDHG